MLIISHFVADEERFDRIVNLLVLVLVLVPVVFVVIAAGPMADAAKLLGGTGLRTEPPTWAQLLPGYGHYRVLLDGGLTDHFDTTGPLLLGLAWLGGLTVLATWLFRHTATSRTQVGRQR